MKHYYAHRTRPGEGIEKQTIDGAEYGDTQVIEKRDERSGVTYYLAKSQGFAQRYYVLRFVNGSWFFTGENRIASDYIAKVEAYLAARQCQSVA